MFNDNTDCAIASFADGNTPYCSSFSLDKAINKLWACTNNLFKWFHENHMRFNADKCHLLVTTRRAGFNGDKCHLLVPTRRAGFNADKCHLLVTTRKSCFYKLNRFLLLFSSFAAEETGKYHSTFRYK